jgi:mRNA-degrading endonuclease RelE of RelBE toxin-antitoxin system
MRISASEQVRLWLQGLPPQTKRRVRADLKELSSGRGEGLDIKALRRELEGFLRLRVGDYRIVYHLEPGRVIRLDYADIRDVVYDAFRRWRSFRAGPAAGPPQRE